MAQSARNILAEALLLPEHERADLAAPLLDSPARSDAPSPRKIALPSWSAALERRSPGARGCLGLPLFDTPPELKIRRALMPRFPYSAVFPELPSEIRIVARAHLKRRPRYWLHRVVR
jgi:hypothetical protein